MTSWAAARMSRQGQIEDLRVPAEPRGPGGVTSRSQALNPAPIGDRIAVNEEVW
jgi:hypothetical protein